MQTDVELSQSLALCMRAGQILLEHGAGTARAEETVRRLGLALGATQVEAFATPTGLFVTLIAGAHSATRVQRIARYDMDLSKIEAVLAISRSVVAGELDAGAAQERLEAVALAERPFLLTWTTIASAASCGASAGLLGGGVSEVVAAASGAALGHLVAELLGRLGLGRMLAPAAGAASASGVAFAAALLFGSHAPAVAMVASILMLTPGVLLVSAVTDLFGGDTISGMARAAMAGLTVTGIAAGVWLILAISGSASLTAQLAPPSWIEALILAAVTTLGFGMLFGVPARRLVGSVLAGVLAYTAYKLAGELGLSVVIATLLGGAAVGIVAELLARRLRTPTALFSIPGIITLVPGEVAFRTMLAFVQGDIPTGVAALVRTAMIAAALAAGLGAVTALALIGKGR